MTQQQYQHQSNGGISKFLLSTIVITTIASSFTSTSSTTSTIVNAFVPSLPTTQTSFRTSSTSWKNGQYMSAPPMEKNVEKEEELLTELEEEILFGEDTKLPYPSTPPRRKSRSGNLLPNSNNNNSNNNNNLLDHSSTNPLINKLHTMRSTLENCPSIWSQLAQSYPEGIALVDQHLCDTKISYTYEQAHTVITKSASVFQSLGVQKGTNVAILGENSAQWLIVDHGIQLAGGSSAVRGADAPIDELQYIYQHSGSKKIAVLQGPKLVQKLQKGYLKQSGKVGLGLENEYGPVETIVLMHREKKSVEDIEEMGKELGVKISVLQDLLDGADPIAKSDIPKVGKEDLATIVYTSGTTGQPKGVMLTHGNLIHQTSHRIAPTMQYDESEPLPGELMLSLLPVWHITERTFEFWMLSRGCSVVYSSIRTFKNDLEKHKPQWMVLVPRVLEKVAMGVQAKFASGSAVVKTLVKLFTFTGTLKATHQKIASGLVVDEEQPNIADKILSRAIVTTLAPLNAVGNKLVWSKVRDGFGGRNKVIISGGSALAGGLESFYELCGLNVCVGYGLTECSPIISYRRRDSNLVTAGCVGNPCEATEVRVVNPELKPDELNGERPALPDGEVGVVIARGPQIMKGYYKNPEATAKAVDKYGFFDTGDLGRINPATGDLILTGRCKDTIVLSNGENIEPLPIEDAIMSESPLIEQVMLTGQDGRSLTAILVLSPNELVNAGLMDESLGKALQKDNEKLNDPKCSEEDAEESCATLSDASMKLRKDDALLSELKKDIKAATKDFRQWEQVNDVLISLEPFAMSNGLLTQSYKVKRDAVHARYKDEL